MAAKCNITGLVLDEIGSLFYGIRSKNNSQAIIENYIESLKCESVRLNICNNAICENEPIIFNCEFNVARTSVEIASDLVIFKIEEEDFYGGVSPFTYSWTFEEDDFIVSGPVNTSELKLLLKTGKVMSNLVTKIAVTVTDANGCSDSRECWLNKGELRCSVNFVPCSNPSNLQLVNNYVSCIGPSALTVTKV